MTDQPTLFDPAPKPKPGPPNVLPLVPDAVLDALATIMSELAKERREAGVTVARTIHIAKARGLDCGPEGRDKNSRLGSWRAHLGKRAGLVATDRTERVDPAWFPHSNMNRQTVWVLPMYAQQRSA